MSNGFFLLISIIAGDEEMDDVGKDEVRTAVDMLPNDDTCSVGGGASGISLVAEDIESVVSEKSVGGFGK